MRARRSVTIVLSGLLVGLALPGVVAGETALPLPTSMAAVGDSITRAASTGGTLGADAPQNSWATGTTTTVLSHAQRLTALGASMSGTVRNHAVSGAKVADLAAQMAAAAVHQPDYLTVLIGGNDVCTDTVAEMTSVADFRSRFQAAMETLVASSPDTNVLVASIPDAYRLWDLFKGSFLARVVWSSADICQSLLASPTSTAAADVERRAAVRQRNIDYNTVLAEVCAAYARCRWDGGAVFATAFTRSDVSGDYFHPSIAGQAKIAATTWAAGYAWATEPPPPPPADEPVWIGGLSGTASTAKSTWVATVTIQAAGSDGAVAGVAVTGTWSTGSGATSCVTGSTGTCTLASSNLSKKTVSVTFAVTSVSGAGFAYQPGSNAASSITVARP